MRYLILLATFFQLVSTASLKGQVVLTPQVPGAGVFMKSQLWNLAIVNTGVKSMSVSIRMTITEQRSGQLVLTGSSRQFQLEMTARQYAYSELGPIMYRDANPAFQVDNTPNGFLPTGQFIVCYALLAYGDEGEGMLAEECIALEVQPISPPQLVIPAENEKVNQLRPSFSWTPPMPYPLFSALQYEITVVEVASYQTPAEAMQNNLPLWRKNALLQTQIAFPEVLPALDTAKLYAWRIQAGNGFSLLSASEIWPFKVQSAGHGTGKKLPGAYLELATYQQNQPVRVQGVFRFVFDNRDNRNHAVIKVFSLEEKTNNAVPLQNNTIALKPGRNFIDLDLPSVAHLREKMLYRIEVVSGSEKRYLTFQYFMP